jgi:hypothetical protein
MKKRAEFDALSRALVSQNPVFRVSAEADKLNVYDW